jgi:hypothetical protein
MVRRRTRFWQENGSPNLNNGVTVVSSGAPGVYLCRSADPAGKTLIVYSNFDISDRNMQSRKTILCRKITVRKTS